MFKKFFYAFLIVFVLFAGVFFLGKLITTFSGGASLKISKSATFFSGEKVALVEIEGGIFDSQEILQELEDVREDDTIQAVVLRLNSPGGAVGPSQEILEAVLLVDKEKPVVASMSSVAASGGYYVALGARKIVANPGTITGSIGVRMEHVELSELLTWAKVNYQTLKSGKYKDLAAIDRPMTSEERTILEDLLHDIHEQFKEAVVTHRNLEKSVVNEIADGRIYSGRQAKALGLVDELGGLDKAVAIAGELADIKNPKLIRKKKKGLFYFEEYLESMISKFVSISLKAISRHPSESWDPVLLYMQ